jgi:hypothetical protein
MSLGLSGISSLAYTGTNVATPAPMYTFGRAPTSNDNQNFNVGSFWLDTSMEVLYFLASLAGGVANWVNISSSGGSGITTILTDSGMATESGGAVSIIGGSNILTSGSTSIVTVSLTGSPVFSGNLTVNGNLHVLGDTTLDGAITFAGLNHVGVLQTNGSGVVTSTTGTNGQVLIGGGTAPTWANITAGNAISITNGANSIAVNVTNGTNGQVLIGGGASPTWANITSTGGTIAITNGPNSINIEDTGTDTLIDLPDTTSPTVGVLRINSLPFLHAYPGTANNNVWLGRAGSTFQSVAGSERNTCIGVQAGNGIISLADNTIVGYNAGASVNGSNNVLVGSSAGSNYTANESNNICIRSVGTAGENLAIHIGDQSGSTATTCFIGGISGVAVVGPSVQVNAQGKLGVNVSSIRFKEHVKDMSSSSDSIYKLRPVTFIYKHDEDKVKQFGLIAEEVNEVLPELVFYDDRGKPLGLRDHQLPALLLNEIQKQQRTIKEQQKAITNLIDRMVSIEEKLLDLQSV